LFYLSVDRRAALAGKSLYHGRVFRGDGRISLFLVGRPERDFKGYQDRLFALLDELEIDWQYAGDDVRPVRDQAQGTYALYPDMYAMADFVLYPSGWEGFGNQLLEAMAARLPMAVFEYPVFKEDIAPKGTRVISLGDRLLEERDRRELVRIPAGILEGAAAEIVAMLTDARAYARTVEDNFTVGKRHFSFDVLRTHLEEVIAWMHG
jgi:glycosyltransferase involved in cell wall biosynthesis